MQNKFEYLYFVLINYPNDYEELGLKKQFGSSSTNLLLKVSQSGA